MIFKIATLFLFVPAIMSVAYFFKNKSKFSFFFLSFLWTTCIVETIGLFIKVENKYANLWVYNIYTFFEFNLIFLMYLNVIKSKLILKGIGVLVFLFNVVYFAAFNRLDQRYTVVVGSVIVSFFFMIYFRELLMSDEILEYRKKLPFWVTVGFIIYYLTTIPFQLVFHHVEDGSFFVIQIIITIIMHSCFIYGLFICRKEKL